MFSIAFLFAFYVVYSECQLPSLYMFINLELICIFVVVLFFLFNYFFQYLFKNFDNFEQKTQFVFAITIFGFWFDLFVFFFCFLYMYLIRTCWWVDSLFCGIGFTKHNWLLNRLSKSYVQQLVQLNMQLLWKQIFSSY